MIDFNKLDLKNSDKAKDIIQILLEVWDSDHYIIICSLEDISNNNNPNEINNWKDIKEDDDFRDNDFFKEYTPEVIYSWKYVTNRLQEELAKVSDVDTYKYLIVIESDNDNNHLIRGLFRANKKEIDTAINPLYDEYRPKSTAEKFDRLYNDDSINIKEFINEHSDKSMIKK